MSRRYPPRGVFLVKRTGDQRFELALERLQSGASFQFRDAAFRLGENGELSCIVESSWNSENVSTSSATSDLRAARDALEHLIEVSPKFAAAMQGRLIRDELVERNVRICSMSDGKFDWEVGFPRRPR